MPSPKKSAMVGRVYLDPGDRLSGRYDPPRRGAAYSAQSSPMRVTLYRADKRAGLRTIRGVRSWTTDLEYAKRYQASYYGREYGGPVLYRGVANIIPAGVVDLRTDPDGEVSEALTTVLDIMGMDEIPEETHTLLREAVPVLQSLGTRWIVFNEYGFDEWLCVGGQRIRVQEHVA